MIELKQIVPNESPVLDDMRRQEVLEEIEKENKELLEKVREEGRREGRREGIREGIEEGIIFTLTELANDPESKCDIEKIAYKFGCSVKEVTDEK